MSLGTKLIIDWLDRHAVGQRSETRHSPLLATLLLPASGMRILPAASLVLVAGGLVSSLLAAARKIQSLDEFQTRAGSVAATLDDLCLKGDQLKKKSKAQLRHDLLAIHQYAGHLLSPPLDRADKQSLELDYLNQVKSVALSTNGLLESCMGKESVLKEVLEANWETLVRQDAGMDLNLDYTEAVQYFTRAFCEWRNRDGEDLVPLDQSGDNDIPKLFDSLDRAANKLVENVEAYSCLIADLTSIFSDLHQTPHRRRLFDSIDKELAELVESIEERSHSLHTALASIPDDQAAEKKQELLASLTRVSNLNEDLKRSIGTSFPALNPEEISNAVQEINKVLSSLDPQTWPVTDETVTTLKKNIQILSKALSHVTQHSEETATPSTFVLREKLESLFSLDHDRLSVLLSNDPLADHELSALVVDFDKLLGQMVQYFVDAFRERFRSYVDWHVVRPVSAEDSDPPAEKRDRLAQASYPYYLWKVYRSLASTRPCLDPAHHLADLVAIVKERVSLTAVPQLVSERIGNVDLKLEEPSPYQDYVRSWKKLGRVLDYIAADSEERSLAVAVDTVKEHLQNERSAQTASAPEAATDALKIINASLERLLSAVSRAPDADVVEMASKFKRFAEFDSLISSCGSTEERSTPLLVELQQFKVLHQRGWQLFIDRLLKWLRADLAIKRTSLKPGFYCSTLDYYTKLHAFYTSATPRNATLTYQLYWKLRTLVDGDNEHVCAKRITSQVVQHVRLQRQVPNVIKRLTAGAFQASPLDISEDFNHYWPALEAALDAHGDWINSWRRMQSVLVDMQNEYRIHGEGKIDEERRERAASWKIIMLFVAIAVSILGIGLLIYTIARQSENGY